MVYYNYVVNETVVEANISYPEVLQRTGLRDQVGLREMGYIENVPVFVMPALTADQINQNIRGMRDSLLRQSDWTQLQDTALTAEKRAEWAVYRQELRDMPTVYANISDPSEIVHPTPPAK